MIENNVFCNKCGKLPIIRKGESLRQSRRRVAQSHEWEIDTSARVAYYTTTFSASTIFKFIIEGVSLQVDFASFSGEQFKILSIKKYHLVLTQYV